MVTEIDEGKGIVKVYWSDIRDRVSKVKPGFAKIIDELDPDKSFPLYLAYYPYGGMIGDTIGPFVPNIEKDCYRLTDPNIPKDIIKHLGYGKNSLPFGILLEKNLEYFIDLKTEKITLPWLICAPGTLFPFGRILNKNSDRVYTPNGILSTTSGARSVFMLPNIGCLLHHTKLQRDYNLQLSPPKSLYDHWHVFKAIINSKVADCHWRSCLLYFAENWLNKIHNDEAWLKLKLYLYEAAWNAFEFERNFIYYHINFSVTQKKRNLKPNPYLADTARHLFTIALGAVPGFAPACNDNALPLEILQKSYIESYGMTKYFPTIMQPVNFNFEYDKTPVFYSLQNASTFIFSPKARSISTTLFEMRELEHIMRNFTHELSKPNAICSDTILSQIAKNVEFKYFHNEFDQHRIIHSSENIPTLDKRFNKISNGQKLAGAKFASDARFVRGCISIAARN